jgi:hypothetical protein
MMQRKSTGAFFGAAVLFAGPVLAAEPGLYYPPGPPAIDSTVYTPASLTTGDVSIAGGLWGYSDFSAFQLLGAGRLNVPLQGGPWNITGEVFGGGLFSDPMQTVLLGALHAYHKTDQYAHGVYASATGWAGPSAHSFALGVEGAAFMGNTTLVGRLGHHWGDGLIVPSSYWTAEGIVRYYVTPDTKLAGIVAWESDPGTVMLAGGIEHLFAGTSMTGFARVSWFAGGGQPDVWEVLGGARFFFHRPGTTLQQHDWDIPFAEATVVNF